MDVRVVLAVALVTAACHHQPAVHATWPDAPLVLRDDTDRDQAIDRLWVMPLGPERDQLRGRIASAIAQRISDAIEEERPFAAALLLDQLTWMWSADPAGVGAGLAPHTRLLAQLRAMFAKSGALEPALQTLVLLAEVEPAHRAEHLAEIEEILAYADELAMADNGPDATRAQPIALLQPTALSLPLPWLVDKYVGLLAERQRTIQALLDRRGATLQLVRAHHDILTTGRRVANVLARAGRVLDVSKVLSTMHGLGIDRELATRAEILADHPTADAYAEMAEALRADEHAPDPAAALATCLAGLRAFPGDPALAAAAAGDARALGRVDEAIALYEVALRGASEVDTSAALRLGKLYGERIGRLATGGRPHAANEAWRGVLAYTSKTARRHPHTVWQQTNAIAQSALGRGLASQGLLDDAHHNLVSSIERAPSIDAYETLSTIDVQVDHFTSATAWAHDGLAMLGDQSSGDRYRRARLERIAGDALAGAGKRTEANARYLDAMRTWAALGEAKELPRTVAAERMLDVGRVMFAMRDADAGADSVIRAVDLDADTPEISAAGVAVLLVNDRYRDAVDAFHLALTSNVGDLSKTYMALWIAGDAKRAGQPLDRLAADYLAGRQGDTWYELLARAAMGHLPYAQLAAAATTGPRQAELAFFTATLDLAPGDKHALLEKVLAAKVVLDAEYDLARHYLK